MFDLNILEKLCLSLYIFLYDNEVCVDLSTVDVLLLSASIHKDNFRTRLVLRCKTMICVSQAFVDTREIRKVSV